MPESDALHRVPRRHAAQPDRQSRPGVPEATDRGEIRRVRGHQDVIAGDDFRVLDGEIVEAEAGGPTDQVGAHLEVAMEHAAADTALDRIDTATARQVIFAASAHRHFVAGAALIKTTLLSDSAAGDLCSAGASSIPFQVASRSRR